MTHPVPKILVVDDSATNRAIYREWLASAGDVEIHEAMGGQEAVEMARRLEFAMIVLDVNMPDMDGFETAAVLRNDQRLEAPILFISAEFNRHQRVRGYRMGAVDCLVTEPTDPEILVQKARVFLQLHRKRQELQAALQDAHRQNQELHSRLATYVNEQQQHGRDATQDLLTGIPNRSLFTDRLKGAVKRAGRTRQHFALAWVQLGDLAVPGQPGDTALADAVIKAIAERLQQAVRATDTVARTGDREFALLFEGLDSSEAAEFLAAKLNRLMLAPVTARLDGTEREFPLGVAIGMALYPDHAGSIEDLCKRAESSVLSARRAGGGARIFDAANGPASPARAANLSIR